MRACGNFKLESSSVEQCEKELYRFDRLGYEQSGRELKNYLKYSILMTLIFMMTISTANALIGDLPNANPYESLPTGRTASTAPPTVTQTSGASMMDGDLGGYGTVYATGTTGTFYWLRFDTFQNTPPSGEFPITWVTLQIKYAHPLGMVDDTYKWEWSIDGATWTELTAATSGKFDSAGAAQVRSWSQLAEPTDGVWTWPEISSVQVRYYVTVGGAGFDGAARPFRIYEVWLSVYSSPVPAAGPSMSLQAPAITAGDAAYQSVFVEVYLSDVTNLAGWEYSISYDPAIMFATEYYNYYPWTDIAAPDLGADYIHIDGTIPVADPLLTTGVSGDSAVARIYFMLNDDGFGLPVDPNFSWLRFTMSLVGDPDATKISHSVYNGYYGTPEDNTYLVGSFPVPRPDPFPYGTPTSTNWVEEYPTFGNVWHLTAWTDNDDTVLGAGDHTDMTPTAPPGETLGNCPVIQVWECFADPDTYAFMIFLGPVPEFPLGIGVVLGLAPAILVIYIWRTRPRKRVST